LVRLILKHQVLTAPEYILCELSGRQNLLLPRVQLDDLVPTPDAVDQLLNVDNLGRLLDARQADFGQVNGNLAPVDHNCEPVVTRVGFDDLVQLAAVVVQVVGVFLLVSLAVPESEDESVAPAFQLLGLVDDEGAAAGFVAVVFVFLEVGGDLLLLGLPGFVFVVYVLVHVWGNRDAVEFED
jgi:hypothetical protein